MGTVPAEYINSDLIISVFQGVVVERNTVAQITIKSGTRVGADDGSRILVAASDVVVDITLSGAGGLDTGVEAVSTWYDYYLIYNISTDITS